VTLDPGRPGFYAFPLFLLLILAEALWYARARHRPYPWRAGATSLAVAAGYKLVGLVTPLALAPIFACAWQNRLATVPLADWSAALLLFLGVEFAYYWFHRASHRCRWLWATHAVHHTPKELTLSAAYRLGWTSLLSGGWLFYLPLVLLGFHPDGVFLALGLNLVYQFLLHTEAVGRLGPLEWLLNTPSHHRVHHACNDGYIDRNYGGVLIVFDRLFGTFAAERDEQPCRYGLASGFDCANPFRLVVHEWLNLARDLGRGRGLSAALATALGPPRKTADLPAGRRLFGVTDLPFPRCSSADTGGPPGEERQIHRQTTITGLRMSP